MAWLKLGSAGVFYPGPALELSGFLGYLTPLASRWGVGLDVIEVPRRWGLALVVDVDFGETVAEPVDVVAGHQGQGVDPGIPGRFGITFFVSPSSAGHARRGRAAPGSQAPAPRPAASPSTGTAVSAAGGAP